LFCNVGIEFFSNPINFCINKINVPTNSELKIQMDMLHISKEDLQVVKVLQPFIYAEIDWITEKFYANITKQPNLITIIDK
jgi:heme-based aerotactic transducer